MVATRHHDQAARALKSHTNSVAHPAVLLDVPPAIIMRPVAPEPVPRLIPGAAREAIEYPLLFLQCAARLPPAVVHWVLPWPVMCSHASAFLKYRVRNPRGIDTITLIQPICSTTSAES